MLYLILAAALYTVAVLLGATAARNANTNLVSLVINLVSVIAPLMVVAPRLAKQSFTGHSYGLWMAALGGLAIGLYVMVLSKAFTENKVGIVTPIVYGTTILASTVLSYFLYKEKISLLEGAGLILVLAGIIVIGYARATTAS